MYRTNSRPANGQKKKSFGFTLVELIVVITILVILGTITFISIQGYSSSARDSTRVADMNSTMKSIELHQIESGNYPNPDSSFAVTYSGGTLWNQGVFGSGTLTRLSRPTINKAPIDPLNGNHYTYSVLAYGKAYQLMANYEGDLAYHPLLIASAHATKIPSLALIKGNYGGLMAKTQTGNTVYVLAIPSIITSTGSLGGPNLEISTNQLSGSLLIHAESNQTGIVFNPNIVVFSGSFLPTSNSNSVITNIMITLKNSYSGTTLATVPAIERLLATPTEELASMGASILKEQLGVVASSNETATAYSSSITYASGQQFLWNGATVTVSATGIGSASTKADPSCASNDIAVWQGGTNNVQIWAACNVGASVNPEYNGSYFQWGRNDNVTTGALISSQWTSELVTPANTTGNTNLYYSGSDWYNYNSQEGSSNPIQWNADNGGDNTGPCPTGYHVPTGGLIGSSTDWGRLHTIINSTTTFGACSQANAFVRMRCALSLPLAGQRLDSYINQGTWGYYWSSTPNGSDAYSVTFMPATGSISSAYRSLARSIRCIRN